ncbi:hypothetical protein Q31b_10510 [Novipirellula aureliae]|uniref:Uncharacterized protein n=1 Tax=Novipirellula aureliae TaxID=2527966 RepID=A0A5C6EBL6_9BACT|nr:DUF1254 domain-containing protein [Novipirellula aureliae]TWU45875.1 hypothetical protein Q31b_10510 [Novipirellula aureliae]
MKSKHHPANLALVLSLAAATIVHAETPPKIKMTTPIPESITTPAKIESRIGTLEFPQGYATDNTAETLYEYLEFMHGVEAFLYALPGASVHAFGRGIKSEGGDNQTVLIFEQLLDSRSLFLTANTESIYNAMWLDLKDGPLVIESPPDILGIVNDHWFRYVGDIGNAGPDKGKGKGKGGKYLLLPPGYKGEVPEGYFVFRSPTFQNLYFWRGFIKDGSTATAVENAKRFAKVHPLAAAKNPPPMKFIDVSGKAFWSFVAYDTPSRSMLQTDQQFPSIGSKNKDIVINADGTVMSGSAQQPPRGMKTIRSRPFPAGVGVCCCVCMDPRKAGSTRPGSRVSSNSWNRLPKLLTPNLHKKHSHPTAKMSQIKNT